MWLACALLISAAASLSRAQTFSRCACIPYFYCGKPSPGNGVCQNPYEICCDDEPSPEPTAMGGGVCGVIGKREDAVGRMEIDWKLFDNFGNTDTFSGEFPWMVAVFNVGATGAQEFLCGGSIVYPNIILTAAHKISGLADTSLRVKAGVWNTSDSLEFKKHQYRMVSNAVVHPGYDVSKIQNDVALLVLSEPLEMTDNVAPVCLPSGDTSFSKTDCIATGWGAGNFGNTSISSVLKKVLLPLVDSERCQEEFREVHRLGSRFNLHNSFICAGREQADTCTGDGGGPLVCPLNDDSDKYVQVGITSWGIGCGERPGAYSSVAAARQWIDTVSDTFPYKRS